MSPLSERQSPFSLAHSLKNALAYIEFGVRELFKYKKFLLIYVFVSLLLAVIISFVSVQLYYDGWRKLSAWYFQICVIVSMAAADIYLIQYVLSKYRKIYPSGKTISLCLLWSMTFPVLGFLISYLISPLDHYLWRDIDNGHKYALMMMFHPLVMETALAAATVWAGFFPFFLLQNFSAPFKESLKIIKKSGFSLAICWVLVWNVTFSFAHITKMGLHDLLRPYFSYDNEYLFGYIIYARHFWIDMLIVLLPSIITTAAYLRETGELSFMPPRKIPHLIEPRDGANI